MPYIIVVNQPGCLPEQDPYAVATIEEAREHLKCELPGTYEWLTDDDYAAMMEDVAALPESGGVVGPLPDGYVIEVQRVSWGDLDETGVLARAGVKFPDDEIVCREIIDAYNAH